ncbi:putative uncharacterized protein C5orf58 homolog [Psammomys obesus]|uniref:putative uncharacterized protein C5orf58 homolog n=1 Tax=Psammomys obesus TaxID=48139 RepID=UPI002452D6AF|nr:putative uncharacterized protein C5orf58 homolog [Psammomys obesus]XP_055460684.1 putative uncharacterized protein C5orf58 homolog [Psammomys obesus]XP_055460685.1 putative uncharacterized protein C5orf58 homolog [Psammomys obesus]
MHLSLAEDAHGSRKPGTLKEEESLILAQNFQHTYAAHRSEAKLPLQNKGEEGKEDGMFKNNHHDYKEKVEAIIKNINTVSLEVKKMKELSQILLCDLNLHFGQYKKTEDLKDAETNQPFEEPEIPDVALASISLSD